MLALTVSEHSHERGLRRHGLRCANPASVRGRCRHAAGGAGWQRAGSTGGAAGARAHLQPRSAPGLAATKEQIRRRAGREQRHCWRIADAAATAPAMRGVAGTLRTRLRARCFRALSCPAHSSPVARSATGRASLLQLRRWRLGEVGWPHAAQRGPGCTWMGTRCPAPELPALRATVKAEGSHGPRWRPPFAGGRVGAEGRGG